MCSSISRPWRDSWSLGEKGEGSPNASEVLWGGKISYSPRALFSGLWGGGGGRESCFPNQKPLLGVGALGFLLRIVSTLQFPDHGTPPQVSSFPKERGGGVQHN